MVLSTHGCKTVKENIACIFGSKQVWMIFMSFIFNIFKLLNFLKWRIPEFLVDRIIESQLGNHQLKYIKWTDLTRINPTTPNMVQFSLILYFLTINQCSFHINCARLGIRPPPIWPKIGIRGRYTILRNHSEGFSHPTPRLQDIDLQRGGEFKWYSKKPVLAFLIFVTSLSLTVHGETLYWSIKLLESVPEPIFYVDSKYAIDIELKII